MAKTLDDGLSYLRYLLASVEGGHWTQAELTKYLNTAQKDVALKLPDELLKGLVSSYQTTFTTTTNEIEITSGMRYYRFIGGYRKKPNDSRKRNILKITYSQLQEIEATERYPNQMFYESYLAELGNYWFLYPAGERDELFVVKYLMYPNEMTQLSDTFSVDDLVYEWVIYYASFLACLKDFQGRAKDFLAILDKMIQEASLIYKFKPPSPFTKIEPK